MSVNRLNPQNETGLLIDPTPETDDRIPPLNFVGTESLLAEVWLRAKIVRARLVECLTRACDELDTYDIAAIVDECYLRYKVGYSKPIDVTIFDRVVFFALVFIPEIKEGLPKFSIQVRIVYWGPL